MRLLRRLCGLVDRKSVNWWGCSPMDLWTEKCKLVRVWTSGPVDSVDLWTCWICAPVDLWTLWICRSVDLWTLWTRGLLGPVDSVDSVDLWTLWTFRLSGSVDVWTLWTCGPVDSVDPWTLWTCGPEDSMDSVDSVELWTLWNCGLFGSVNVWTLWTCGICRSVDLWTLWPRGLCGPVDLWTLWTRGFCGPVDSVDSVDLWTLWICGPVDSVDVWTLWTCGRCGPVDSVDLWTWGNRLTHELKCCVVSYFVWFIAFWNCFFYSPLGNNLGKLCIETEVIYSSVMTYTVLRYLQKQLLFGFSPKYTAPESVFVLLFLSISKALLFVNRSDLGPLRFLIGGFQSVWFVSVF